MAVAAGTTAQAAPVHSIPLRMLLGNPRLAEWLQSRLHARHGWQVRASADSARLRIRGAADPAQVEQAVQSALRVYGLTPLRLPPPRPRRRATDAAGPARPRPAYHAVPLRKLFHDVASSAQGLSAQEAVWRLQRNGRNELADIVGRSTAAILLGQFTSLPMTLLAVAAGLAWWTRARGEAAAIGGVMALNAALGFATELHAERSVASLRRLAPGRARVLRDGVVCAIPAAEVVVGDVLLLEPGERVVADARVIEADRLAANEAPLTGESLAVAKQAEDTLPANTALAERRNMVHLGTLIAEGHGRAVVVATAADSMLGLIRELAQAAHPPRTRLQQDLDQLGGGLALAAGAVCIGMFLLGLLRGRPLWPLLRTAVSLGVAAIPEGLATVATSLMAMTIQRLRRQRVYARSLEALESLGSVDVVCFDKTGTLTRNEMHAGIVSFAGRRIAATQDGWSVDALAALPRELLEVAVLCNDAGRDGLDSGSSTERALLDLAAQAGVRADTLREQWPLIAVRRRSQQYAHMQTLHQPRRGLARLAVKGNPQEVLARCAFVLRDGRKLRLGAAQRREILRENTLLAAQGYRVLGLAERRQRERELRNGNDMTWLGLIGLSDPLRERMPETMAAFERAGIRALVLTGDQPGTAQAITRAVGIDRRGKVVDGSALPEDNAALALEIDRANAIARATPGLKLSAVKALQQRGHVVAMLGDGINDGPALRAADVGVAMGASGTDFAQAMSDLVLEADHPERLLAAIADGRTVYRNIRKSVQYLVATNLSEVLLMGASVGVGLPDPLSPMALLWTNLATDIAPAIALGLEPAEADVLQRPPPGRGSHLLERSDLRVILGDAGTMAGAALSAFLYGLARHGNGASAQTLSFATLNLAQLLHAWSARSELPIGAPQRRPNRLLDGALLATLAAAAAAVGVPTLRRLIGAGTIGWGDAMVAGIAGSLPLLLREARKHAGAIR